MPGSIRRVLCLRADRKPNFQNDRIWALRNDDIPEELKQRQVSKHPKCLGIFVMFTAKRMLVVVKENGESWSGQYFRDIVLAEHVIPFLKDGQNVDKYT